MTHECRQEENISDLKKFRDKFINNGYIKFKTFVWIVGLIIYALYYLATNVIANENENKKSHEGINKCVTEYIIPMSERLARIEAKIEK